MSSQPVLPDEFDQLVDDLKEEAQERGFLLKDHRLDYGYRLFFPQGGERGSFTIYYSPRKKRYSIVAPDFIDPDLIPLVELAVFRTGVKSPFKREIEETFTSWEDVLSDDPGLSRHIAEALPELQKKEFLLADFTKLQNGIQLEILKDEKAYKVNLYAGKDGRTKVVPSGKRTRELKAIVAILTPEQHVRDILPGPEQRLVSWLGTDEAGKGDYFGSLVVAGFRADWDVVEELEGMGLVESKRVSDARVRKLASVLWGKFKGHCGVVEIAPERYNDLYEQFRGGGGKLNLLLGWAHARVIREFHEKGKISAVVIDKFGAEWNITKYLKDAKDIKLHFRARAESNPAVAAASILARDRFLRRLEKLSDEFDMKLPPGAGDKVIKAGRAFVEKHGEDALRKVAKLHFKTTERIGEAGEEIDE